MKKVNYTAEQIAVLENAQPLNQAIAVELAEQLGKTSRSIIAKAKSLGLDYEVKVKPAKRVAASKADLVNAIAKAVDADDNSLTGLEKAPMIALSNLLSNLS